MRGAELGVELRGEGACPLAADGARIAVVGEQPVLGRVLDRQRVLDVAEEERVLGGDRVHHALNEEPLLVGHVERAASRW